MHPALAFVFIVPFLPTGPHVHADADLNDPHHGVPHVLARHDAE